jgi:outer membrane lipoprotein-sorting protein
MLNPLLPWAVAALVAGPDSAAEARRAAFEANDVLAKMRAAYEKLTSYADSGTVLDASSGYTERATFRILYTKDPSNLLIDFRSIGSEYDTGIRVPNDQRIVLWMEKGELQTWSTVSQRHETYPAAGGQQVNAVQGADVFTRGISVLVPSHLYSKSGMASAVQATEDAEADGFETVNGRKCYRLLGVERWRYPSGQETGVRAITIWVDAETYLILKVFEDTPKGYPRNQISHRTTTIKPRANPKLAPALFRYTVPER